MSRTAILSAAQTLGRYGAEWSADKTPQEIVQTVAVAVWALFIAVWLVWYLTEVALLLF